MVRDTRRGRTYTTSPVTKLTKPGNLKVSVPKKWQPAVPSQDAKTPPRLVCRPPPRLGASDLARAVILIRFRPSAWPLQAPLCALGVFAWGISAPEAEIRETSKPVPSCLCPLRRSKGENDGTNDEIGSLEASGLAIGGKSRQI